MKRAKRLPIFSTLIVVVAACAFTGLPAYATCDADVTQAGDTWFVSPTGTDDTANIQCAFDEAVTAGAGNTVHLMAGTFYTSIITVVGFDGFFKGVGKDATVITSLPHLPCADAVARLSFPSLFKFREGNIRVSDLSFNITEFAPCDLWTVPGQPVRDDLGTIVNIAGPRVEEPNCTDPIMGFVSSSFERVGFTGSIGTFRGKNVNKGLWVVPDGRSQSCVSSLRLLVGTHAVSNSSFTNLYGGAQAINLANGSFTVGGSPNKRNTFDHVNLAIIAFDTSDSVVEISFNDIKNATNFGVYVLQGARTIRFGHPLPSPSEFLISHNTIHAIVFADGVGLEDYGPLFGGGKTLEAVVSNNKIILDNTLFGGIVGIFAQDAVVSNNKITGTGGAGIYGGVFGDTVAGWMIEGNNVENVNATSPLFPISANILLGPGTSNCTVVGGSSKTNVLDQGTNNILVGVNNMGQGQELGQALRDAMKQKLELRKSVW